MAAKQSQLGGEIPSLDPYNPPQQPRVEVPSSGDGFKQVTLYSPGQFRVSMNDSIDPSALGQEEWTDVTNVRTDTGVIQVRYGPAVLLPGTGGNTLASRVSAVANSVFRGGIYHDRTGIVILAFSASNKTRVIGYSPSNDGWYDITASSGDYGDTRFPSAGSPANFAICHESHYLGTFPFSSLSDHDYAVVQIGDTGAYPVVFPLVDTTASFGGPFIGGASLHKPIIAPDTARSTYQAQPWKTFDVTATGGMTWTVDVGATLSAQTTANSAVYWKASFLIGACTATNKASTQGFTGVEAAAASQLHIVFNSNYGTSVWQNLKVYIRKATGAAWKLIYDPTSSDAALREPPIFVEAGTFDDNAATVPGAGGQCWLAAFNLVNSDIVAGDNYDGIKYEWIPATSPPVTVVVNTFLIGFAKGRSGGAEFAVSYFNSRARAESQGVVCRYLPTTDLGAIGGSRALGITYPVSPSCIYSYRVSTNQPATSSLSKGDDYILTYCKPYGEFDYLLVSGIDHMVLQTLSAGAWGYPSGLSAPDTASPTANSVRSRFVFNEGLVDRTCPVALHAPIPIGTTMACINGRLFVGNVRWDASNTNGRGIAVSDAKNPFRFSLQTRLYENGYIDPTSPGFLSLNGEQPQALTSIAGGWGGADSLLILTSRSLWACGGTDIRSISRPERVSVHGTRSPGSLAAYQGMVMWLDDSLQVRTYGARNGSISKRRVETALKAIPAAQIANVQGFMSNDRYYLAFAGNGQTENRNVLVYDFRTEAWSLDTRTSAGAPAGFISIDSASVRRHAYCTSAGVLNEYEVAGTTTDFGTAIPVALTPPMVKDHLWNTVSVGSVGIFMDKASSCTMTINRVPKHSVTTPTATTIATDGTASYSALWLYDNVDSTSSAPTFTVTPGIMDVGVQVKLTASLPGGTKIYTIVAHVQAQREGASALE